MKEQGKDTVVVIGSFDGVHRGHNAIFQAARSAADATGRRCLCLTFHPHPKRIVDPDAAPRLLTMPDEKEHLARARGVDEVITMEFNRELAGTTAEDFAERVLLERLGARHLVIGYDFGFGKGRRGNGIFLTEWGRDHGITVTIVNAIKIEGLSVSSSRIRRLVNAGRFEEALVLLGHHYTVFGHVAAGEGRGKSLGYPTMNITTSDDKLLPPIGVYAARIEIARQRYGAMAYIGTKPTFGQYPLAVEIHVFDYPGGNPDGRVHAWFTNWVRPDQRFDSHTELKKQLARDETYVRGLLNKMK
ncbi:riboflavin biosynthesis protein RibF [Candidatus Zixiibacteriota bacterium]